MENCTYHLPPAHSHGLNPDDIISPEEMVLLTRHYRATAWKNVDDFNKAVSSFTQEERSMCVSSYQKLRDYGFYPAGYDNRGIQWRIALKSSVQSIMDRLAREDGLPRSEDTPDSYKLPDGEMLRLRNLARANFRVFRDQHSDAEQDMV